MEFEYFQSKVNGPLTKEAAATILELKGHRSWKDFADQLGISFVKSVTLNNAVSRCEGNEKRLPTINVSTETARKLYQKLFDQKGPDAFPEITEELLLRGEWTKILEERTPESYSEISRVFNLQSKSASDAATAQLFGLISEVFSIALSLMDSRHPFRPFATFRGQRTMGIEDLNEKNLHTLARLRCETSNILFKSRLSDILWVTTRNLDAAHFAVSEYLSLAKAIYARDFESQQYIEANQFLERAAQIWKVLGSDSNVFEELAQVADLGMSLDVPEPEGLARILVLDIVAEFGLTKNPEGLLGQVEELSGKCRDSRRYDKSRRYLDIAVKFAKQLNHQDLLRRLNERQGDLYAEEARDPNTTASAMRAVHYYNKAIHFNQNLGRSALVKQLHAEMNSFQNRILGEMKAVSVKVDLSDIAERGRKAVKGKPIEDALKGIALLVRPLDIASLRERLKNEIKPFILHRLISSVEFNDRGKVVARREPMSSDDQNSQDVGLKLEVIQYVSQHQSILAVAPLELARQTLERETSATKKIFREWVAASPFVPPGREEIFERGLEAGLVGDWYTSLHLLVPQFENSIRYLLEKNGILISKFKPDMTQKEIGLDDMLYKGFKPEVEKILGPDLVSALSVLLTEPCGKNLRHRLCHGLLESSYFSHPDPANYVWALTIHLMYLGILAVNRQAVTGNT